jgi:hypothetical protein
VSSYLVFFALGTVDDALATAIVERVRASPGAGWFDDVSGERTTGGFVRVDAVEDPDGEALLDAARELSRDHGAVLEVQWREKVIGHIEGGTWRSSSTSTRTT